MTNQAELETGSAHLQQQGTQGCSSLSSRLSALSAPPHSPRQVGLSQNPGGLFSRPTDSVQGPARPLPCTIRGSSSRQGARAPPKGTCHERHEHTSPSSTPAAKISPSPRGTAILPQEGEPPPRRKVTTRCFCKGPRNACPHEFPNPTPGGREPGSGRTARAEVLSTHTLRATPRCNDRSRHCL